jgi:histidine kinase
MNPGSPPRHDALASLLVVAGTVAAMALGYALAGHRALGQEVAELQRESQLYSQSLQRSIDRYRTLPQVLALDPELLEAVQGPIDEPRRERLNRRLEDANSVTRSSTLTLIDRSGVAIAASNWRLPSSNVGKNYSFRPYVIQALAGGRGRFYGIGLTTGTAGYYLSEALRDRRGALAGVVVIKIELEALEREWRDTTDTVLVTDSHGVAFLTNRDELRYRTLRPLADADRREIAATRQYAEQVLAPLDLSRFEPLGGGAQRVRIGGDAEVRNVLWQTATLPDEQWQVHLVHDASSTRTASRTAALAAGSVWLALAFLVLFVRQRRRLSALRQRSRDELEAVLKQHAEALRTARDSVVESARQADAGLSRSLEHLPQGVVIIDAGLRLVAWNSRYVELFRFPPELLRIGQPIEALFRHNAQRGLLGPGPVEEAIERRLDFLRQGTPHMRETVKEDGTTLEIRGTPLPDGGFVTSYADITTYKNAARELRSLADALEQRVEKRTQALVEAKQDAERANRYKTRFVAAAVHDLLQPLNAARMFLSTLRGRIGDAEMSRVAERVDLALSSQDAILNSLLDISRMESGAMPVDLADVPLGPLIDTLAAEFGIVAESRGLRLRRVATTAVARTDEALLRRILQNFLSNAVRYTRTGKVLIGCRNLGDAIRIEVHDQGPGIPESQLEDVFEEFRRLDDGVASDRGAGLGLAIVERIGRVLGHAIGVRSTLGVGSVFSVTLPRSQPDRQRAAPAAAAPAMRSEGADLEGFRVWCVDDDLPARAMTLGVVGRWRCMVEFEGGTADFEAAIGQRPWPDLLLLDPHGAAVEPAALLARLAQRWPADAPVALLTPRRDDAIRAVSQARHWALLDKPVRPSAIRSVIMQALLRQGRPGAGVER